MLMAAKMEYICKEDWDDDMLCFVVALPFSASLGLVVHAQILVLGLASSWFDYHGLSPKS